MFIYLTDGNGKNFLLTFPAKSVTDYVRYDLQRCAPPLIGFTVCFWIKTDDQGDDGSSFSYSLPDEDDQIVVRDYKSFKLLIGGDRE